jgi:hypothetical protein
VLITKRKVLEHVIQGGALAPLVIKLFHKTLVKHTRFDQKLHYGEDNLFLVDALLSCGDSIAYVSKILYHYRIRMDSAMMQKVFIRWFSVLKKKKKIAERVAPASKRLKRVARLHIITFAGSCCLRAFESGNQAYLPQIKQKARPHIWNCLTFPGTYILQKRLQGVAVLLFPKLAYRYMQRGNK